MDEATLFKFGKCVDYVNPHQGKISHWNGCGLGHVTTF